MNLAILILFWTLIGWKFAFAEFFGGIAIIAVVSAGSLLLRPTVRAPETGGAESDENEFRDDPLRGGAAKEAEGEPRGFAPSPETWREIVEVALGDVAMLRNELILGFVIAGFAAALIPPAWLAGALHAVGSVPIGYPLLAVPGLRWRRSRSFARWGTFRSRASWRPPAFHSARTRPSSTEICSSRRSAFTASRSLRARLGLPRLVRHRSDVGGRADGRGDRWRFRRFVDGVDGSTIDSRHCRTRFALVRRRRAQPIRFLGRPPDRRLARISASCRLCQS